jgi:putative heme-binding domain-containing protein
VSLNSYADTVAPTDALSADEQQKKFKLPKGFEIQLVVSEPDIGQPMNLNFDARGRLWITHSVEYPYPAKSDDVEERSGKFAGGGKDAPRDKLTIVEGISSKGVKKIIHFAEGLNIPIGQTPIGNGDSAIVYSIPNIYLLRDTDGDGKADTRKLLYGKFGNRDTHGMASSFTRWIDGWIYGCHGFSNSSEVRDSSGNVVKMNSGNTYRFREDGSHFQQFTWGQVNPFGMTFDASGNLYNSDCHSMPINLLLRGAQYPHWNSPGPLGFGPNIIFHSHGSTGISGPAYYAAEQFPEEYRDNLFICNPVNGLVHRDRLKQFGSTRKIVNSIPDFLSCDDPWFRPVDSIVGPDGALYIADFYNAIIGHYEVPLDHPKRDRKLGRVWRIVYSENDSELPAPNLARLRVAKLVQKLSDPNLAVRALATNYLVDTRKWFVTGKVRKAMRKGSPSQRAHSLWVLERRRGLKDSEATDLAADESVIVRTHLMRALAERKEWNPVILEVVQNRMSDKDAVVRRAAADALGQHPHHAGLKPLLSAWLEADKEDVLLIHTIKLSLREHLNSAEVVNHMSDFEFTPQELELLWVIVPAAESGPIASFVLKHLDAGLMSSDRLKQITPYLCRHADAAQHQKIIQFVRQKYREDVSNQFSLFEAVHEASASRSDLSNLKSELGNWLNAMAPSLLKDLDVPQWVNFALPDLPPSASPWGLRERTSEDGRKAPFIDSLVHGEQRTGLYRSRPFSIPEKLSFWIAGHNGKPGNTLPPVNHLRLKLVKTGKIVARQEPPRNDTAKKIEWELNEHKGNEAVLEIVDADNGASFAWLAVSRFEPEVVKVETQVFKQGSSFLKMLGIYALEEYTRPIINIAVDSRQSVEIRLAAAEAGIQLGQGEKILPLLSNFISHPEMATSQKMQAIKLVAGMKTSAAREKLTAAFTSATAELQNVLAMALCQTSEGAESLLQKIAKGEASARILQDKKVNERFMLKATVKSRERATELLKELPPADEQLLQKIRALRDSYLRASASESRGKSVFQKNCAACHRIGSEGATVGPQLDGIGRRGTERLLEDILDPDRNVDAAFGTINITTNEGDIFSGLKASEDAQAIVIVDSQAREHRILLNEIAQIKPSRLSHMPSGFAEVLQKEEIHDLLTYLISGSRSTKE